MLVARLPESSVVAMAVRPLSATGEGQLTKAVYSLVAEQKFGEAAAALEARRADFPGSRAVLSLLGYCYYHAGTDYAAAARCYAELAQVCPRSQICTSQSASAAAARAPPPPPALSAARPAQATA